MNTDAWARLSDSTAIAKNLIQHIQLVTEFEPDLSPILSLKNYLMLPLTRA